jgi:hypothetical protein
MITALVALAAGFACLTESPSRGSIPARPSPLTSHPSRADSVYQRLFESGSTFEAFVDQARSRKDEWRRNFDSAVVPDALLARVAQAGGPWRLLVVTADGCSDSVNSVPYLARLVERVPGMQIRLVSSSVGRAVMEAHRTPDGRAATPTVILLDADYAERGCWIERPAELIAWMADQRGKVSDGELFAGKMKWYEEDKGAKSLEGIVAVIEAAGRGETLCAGK